MGYLEIVAVRKVFGDVVALHGITLSVQRGEFFTLLGPSGCGKTTLLRIVAGFETPDEGAVWLDGEDITELPPNRRNMGMVFQSYSLFPNMTAEENVEFGLRVRGVPPAERARRVGELFELIGLAAARKRYPHQLSGGEQQRVALARALAIEPRVLLLDEPLSALDAQIRVQLREEIRAIQSRLGITTLYVTHDQEEAMAISDRVAVLSRGRVEQVGTPSEIYERPATPFVAGFVGTMNRLEAVVRDGERGYLEYRGLPLRVDAARGLAPGTRVLVLVRPEVIQLHPPGSAEGFKGRVLSRAFGGATTRIRVQLEVGGELVVDVPSVRARPLAA
ncbi:MAG: ABC transporter ATP-binding protein, partial [bacterium]